MKPKENYKNTLCKKYIQDNVVHSSHALELICLILFMMHVAYDRSCSPRAGVGDLRKQVREMLVVHQHQVQRNTNIV
jgi:hypothetical protein